MDGRKEGRQKFRSVVRRATVRILSKSMKACRMFIDLYKAMQIVKMQYVALLDSQQLRIICVLRLQLISLN